MGVLIWLTQDSYLIEVANTLCAQVMLPLNALDTIDHGFEQPQLFRSGAECRSRYATKLVMMVDVTTLF